MENKAKKMTRRSRIYFERKKMHPATVKFEMGERSFMGDLLFFGRAAQKIEYGEDGLPTFIHEKFENIFVKPTK